MQWTEQWHLIQTRWVLMEWLCFCIMYLFDKIQYFHHPHQIDLTFLPIMRSSLCPEMFWFLREHVLAMTLWTPELYSHGKWYMNINMMYIVYAYGSKQLKPIWKTELPFLEAFITVIARSLLWPVYTDSQTAANVWQQKFTRLSMIPFMYFYNKEIFMTGDCIGDMYLCGGENT